MIKKFFQKYFFFVRHWWHAFLVFKNKKYLKHHKDLKEWFQKKYKKNFGRVLNFDNPTLFSEKLYIQMMNFDNPLGKTLVDKITVKDYLIQQGYSKYITPNYLCFNSAKEVDFSTLPNEFVIKCNHDSGSTFLVNKANKTIKDRDGRNYSMRKMRSYLKKSLKTSMYYQGFEKQYDGVVPRILTEEIIKTGDGEFLADYKLFCNYGQIVFIYVVIGRSNKGEKTIFVDKDFNLIYTNSDEEIDCQKYKPEKLDEMIKFASSISKDYKIARVDLYYTKSLGIRFGEIAFSHYGGTNTGASYPDYNSDLLLGGMFK